LCSWSRCTFSCSQTKRLLLSFGLVRAEWILFKI